MLTVVHVSNRTTPLGWPSPCANSTHRVKRRCPATACSTCAIGTVSDDRERTSITTYEYSWRVPVPRRPRRRGHSYVCFGFFVDALETISTTLGPSASSAVAVIQKAAPCALHSALTALLGTGRGQHPRCYSTFYTPPSVLRKPRWSLPLATRAPSSLRISKSCRLNSLLRVASGQYGTGARCQGGTRLRKIDPCTRARRWIRAPSRTCVPRHAAQTLRNAVVCSAVLRPPATTASG